MAEITAIGTARMWLGSAEASMNSKIYPTAIYGMEMAVEIALKAVLMAFNANVPKLHNVMSVLHIVFDENRNALPKTFIEKEALIFDTYNDLLEERPLVGYTFETNAKTASVDKAREYMKRAKEVVDLCELAVRYIGKK